MSIVNVTSENFNELINGDKPVLIDFFADWCGPCQMLAPIIHEIADENEDIIVGKVNTDTSPEIAIKFSVMSIPTLIIFKGGEAVGQVVGLRSKEQILNLIKNS